MYTGAPAKNKVDDENVHQNDKGNSCCFASTSSLSTPHNVISSTSQNNTTFETMLNIQIKYVDVSNGCNDGGTENNNSDTTNYDGNDLVASNGDRGVATQTETTTMSMKITQHDSVSQPFTSECMSIDHVSIQIQHNVGLPLCVSPDAMNKIIECVVDEFQDHQANFYGKHLKLLKDGNVDAAGFTGMDMNALVVVPLNIKKNSNVQIELHCEHNWNQTKQMNNYKNFFELEFNHEEIIEVKRKVNELLQMFSEKDDQAMDILTIGSKIYKVLLTENCYDLQLDNSASSKKRAVLCDIIQDEINNYNKTKYVDPWYNQKSEPLVGGFQTVPTCTGTGTTGTQRAAHLAAGTLDGTSKLVVKDEDEDNSFCGCD
jgi:hypothetical protein